MLVTCPNFSFMKKDPGIMDDGIASPVDRYWWMYFSGNMCLYWGPPEADMLVQKRVAIWSMTLAIAGGRFWFLVPLKSTILMQRISETGRTAFLCVDQTILPSTSPILYAAAHTTLRLFSSSAFCSSCVYIYLLIFSTRCELFEGLLRL